MTIRYLKDYMARKIPFRQWRRLSHVFAAVGIIRIVSRHIPFYWSEWVTD